MTGKALYPARELFIETLGFKRDDVKTWVNKWQSLRNNAPTRGISCKLSFEEYMGLAKLAGIMRPGLIGKTSDSYQMGRIKDTGDYELGNCRFITVKQNHLEMVENGGAKVTGDKTSKLTKANNSPSRISQANKISKRFIFTSPDGVVYEGRNIKEFCVGRNLHSPNMGEICSTGGKYKGWTGKFIEEKI